MASLFKTGRVPGWPRHIGQTLAFGFSSSGSFLQEQNIFEAVLSSACISRPIVGMYLGVVSWAFSSSFAGSLCGMEKA